MQLDLFNWRQDAVLYAFPTSRRKNLVKQAASAITNRSFQQGKKYWTTHIREIRKELASVGLTASTIDAEINSYTHAVSQELNITRHYRGNPDNAA